MTKVTIIELEPNFEALDSYSKEFNKLLFTHCNTWIKFNELDIIQYMRTIAMIYGILHLSNFRIMINKFDCALDKLHLLLSDIVIPIDFLKLIIDINKTYTNSEQDKLVNGDIIYITMWPVFDGLRPLYESLPYLKLDIMNGIAATVNNLNLNFVSLNNIA